MFGIDDAVSAVSNLAKTVVDKIWPDATLIEKAKIEQITQEMQNQYNEVLGQLKINETEAASSSTLVAGWRPFIGWVCGISLAYVAIIEPFARFLAVVAFAYTGVFPVIDTTLTMQIMMGMLGLAGVRSYDKLKQTDTKKLGK